MRVSPCRRAGPECQGQGVAQHLVHVLRSDRLGNGHPQQAPARDRSRLVPRKRTGEIPASTRQQPKLEEN